VLDGRGHATRAGAEVRLHAPATGRAPLATRLVDTGSGYNSQNVAPVHFGLGSAQDVHIEVIVLTARGRVTATLPAATVAPHIGRTIRIRVDDEGNAAIVN
jgi:hypothetical protein